MKVFRLTKQKYARDLNGKGAARFGNRWNSKGTEMIYTVESRALAMAEVAVHLTLASIPSDYMMIELEIPDTIKINTLKSDKLPLDWNAHPPGIHTQKIGDEFIDDDDDDTCVLKVPSAVVKGVFNFLINPHHQDLKKIKIISITNFPIDKRIFK